MEAIELDRDFLRFRDEGSPEALARVFDATAPRLLLVAGHLTRDAARAEDLVQTTFLHAMRDASSFDGGRPVTAWLAGILRNRAIDEHRKSAVRRGEALPEGELVDRLDPAEVVADEEAFDAVVTAVLALEEPYRSVCNLRVVHGLSPAAIAHALGRKPGTVRMQLKRGLDSLRRTVPAGGFLAAFEDGARGLDAVREAVLGAVAPTPALHAPTAAAPGGSAVTALGGILTVKALIGLSAAITLAALLTWWTNRDGRPEGEVSAARNDEAGLAVSSPSPAREIASAGDGAETAREASEVAAPDVTVEAPPTELFVQAVYAADGRAAEDVGVYVRAANDAGLGREARTDASGTATFRELAEGPLEVHLDRLSEPTTIAWPEESRAVVRIPPGLRVDGRVVDLEDEGVGGAAVYRHNPRHHDLLQLVATADEDGRFVLTDCEDEVELLARAPRHQPSELERVRGEAGAAPIELQLGANGHILSGRVLLPNGKPAPMAWVLIGVDEDAREAPEGSTRHPLHRERKAMDREGLLVRADAAGRFSTDEVPGGHTLVVARAQSEGTELVGWLTLSMAGDREDEVTVKLGGGAELSGAVRTPDGDPVAGVAVEVEWEGMAELGQMEDDLGPFVSDVRAVTGPDGSYALRGLLPGEHDLRVYFHGEELAEAEQQIADEQRASWNPIVGAPAELNLVLLGSNGEALAGWRVASFRPERPWSQDLRSEASTPDGRVMLPAIGEDEVDVALFPPTGGGGFAPLRTATRASVPVEGDAAKRTLRLTADEMPTASLAGQLAGELPRGARVVLRRPNSEERWQAWPDADGRFRFAPLAPGAVELKLDARGQAEELALGGWILGIEESLDVGRLELSTPTSE